MLCKIYLTQASLGERNNLNNNKGRQNLYSIPELNNISKLR